MKSTKGVSLVDFLLAVSIGAAFVLFSASNSNFRNVTKHLDIAMNNAEAMLQALDKHYYSYCRDPSAAPTLTVARLISDGHLVSNKPALTHFSPSPMTLSVQWSPPAHVQVTIPAGDADTATLLANHIGTAQASGSNVIVRRTPRGFQPALNNDRATFSKLFETTGCRV